MAELSLRGCGFAACIALVLVLTRARRAGFRAQALAWLAATVGAFMLTSAPGASEHFGAAIYPLTALCSTHPVWFWIAASAFFVDGFRLRAPHVVALASMSVAGVTYQSMFPVDEGAAGVRILGLAFGAATLTFAALAPLSVLRGIAGDLDEHRRRVRHVFVPVTTAYLGIIVVTQAVVLLRGGSTPDPLVLANLIALVSAAMLALASFVRVRVVNWVDAPGTNASGALSRSEQAALANLRRRFGAERLYARPVSIVDLSAQLGTQEHVLRKVINHGLGFRNFNDFLHEYRLAEVARRLRDPAERRIPILTLALEAGYGSIGPFNRAFRDRFGVTPSQYRRAPESDGAPLSDSA